MTDRPTSGPDWEFANAVDALVRGLHDFHTATRSSSASMAASVMVLMMDRIEQLERRVAALEQALDDAHSDDVPTA